MRTQTPVDQLGVGEVIGDEAPRVFQHDHLRGPFAQILGRHPGQSARRRPRRRRDQIGYLLGRCRRYIRAATAQRPPRRLLPRQVLRPSAQPALEDRLLVHRGSELGAVAEMIGGPLGWIGRLCRHMFDRHRTSQVLRHVIEREAAVGEPRAVILS